MFPGRPPNDAHALTLMGSLGTAFLFSFMITAPIFGWFADRMSRWLLVGISVMLWSLATGASGLAPTFTILLITRLLVGVGEGGYGPSAPTIISDLYPVKRRGSVLAWFYMAIPVGSALGYILGGAVEHYFGWRKAFFAVTPPGLLLGLFCFFRKDPPRGAIDAASPRARKITLRDYLVLLRIPSYLLDTVGMTAMCFAIGGISFWMPTYIAQRPGAGDLSHVNLVFGGLTALAGITGTLAGGFAGDALRSRFSGSYFLVSGIGILLCCPFILLILVLPFPLAWGAIFLAEFWLFFNTGPSNTILANVTHPSIRSLAFAVNIFLIHALGDAASPPILGSVVSHFGWSKAFCVVTAVTALAGILWTLGARHLEKDTQRAIHVLT